MDMKTKYIVSSRDEYDALEKKMEEFFKSYGINGIGPVCVSSLINGIDISPEECGIIEEVYSVISNPEGRLAKATDKFLLLNIGETGFLITYKPKKSDK